MQTGILACAGLKPHFRRNKATLEREREREKRNQIWFCLIPSSLLSHLCLKTRAQEKKTNFKNLAMKKNPLKKNLGKEETNRSYYLLKFLFFFKPSDQIGPDRWKKKKEKKSGCSFHAPSKFCSSSSRPLFHPRFLFYFFFKGFFLFR